jgi:hypothetical protein
VSSRVRIKLSEGDAVKFLKEPMILRGQNQEDGRRAISGPSAGGAAEVSPLRKEWVRNI